MTAAPAISWKKAVGFALLAAYGPFIIMAIYTFVMVSCSHCKGLAWALVPCAPATIPMENLARWLDLRKLPISLWVSLSAAFVSSLAIAFLLACLVRRGGRLGVVVLGVAVVVFSYFAFILLGRIQM